MLFEWDEEKAKINKVKHGISFETATMVFMDEERIEYYDEEHSEMEDIYNDRLCRRCIVGSLYI